MKKKGYMYITASKPNGILYIGVTSNLKNRNQQHKDKNGSEFTKKYFVNKLVYFEEYDLIIDAIAREKQLKKWRREKKIVLIEKMNPKWEDLALML